MVVAERSSARTGAASWFPASQGPRFAIRDRENGTLILGGLSDRLQTLDAKPEPLAFAKPLPMCSTLRREGCKNEYVRTVYYSLEAQADAPVRIETGTKQDITLGGVAYELTLFEATSEEGAGAPTDTPCADFYGYRSTVWVTASILPKAEREEDAGAPR